MSLPKPKEELVKNVGSDHVAGTSIEKDGGQESLMPSFVDMVNYIHEKVSFPSHCVVVKQPTDVLDVARVTWEHHCM